MNEDEPTGSLLAQHARQGSVPPRAKGPRQAGQQENPKTEAVGVELPGLARAQRKEIATAIDVNVNISV